MSAVLPQGWQDYRLEECVEVLDSLRVPVNNAERQSRIEGKPAEQLYPYYGATGQVGVIDDFLFDEELVALGEDGVPFLDPFKPKAYMLRGKTWVNNHAHVLRGLDGIALNKFVFYYLNQFDYQGYVNGGTRLKLTQANMRIIPIPLPPLAEQIRIAAKLDELLAQVDTLKARIDGIPALLKRFRQSVLAAAVSGRLTEEWRKASLENKQTAIYLSVEAKYSDSELRLEIPETWKAVKLNDACKVISGYAFSSGSFISAGIPVVKISNVQYGCFEEKNQEYLPLEFVETHKKFIVHPKDLLMALTRPITNNTLKICEYPKDAAPALLNQRVCKFVFNSPESKEFFEYLFQAEYFKKQVASNLSETLQPNLSPKDLGLLTIGLPPLQEQTEIVRRVEQLFAFADQLEARLKAAQAHIDRLTQSILAKAFRGELVPQDPDDEPASVLLERIKAQRAAAPKTKRGRRAATPS
ncbi:restriction endonuclease subunit S [Pseudomonas sp. NPDC047963]